MPPKSIHMEQYNFSSLITLGAFLEIINADSLKFLKGKGRQFTSTAVGTVFMAAAFKKDEPAYIAFGGDNLMTKPKLDGQGQPIPGSEVSLKGTFWLVNSVVQEGDTITATI